LLPPAFSFLSSFVLLLPLLSALVKIIAVSHRRQRSPPHHVLRLAVKDRSSPSTRKLLRIAAKTADSSTKPDRYCIHRHRPSVRGSGGGSVGPWWDGPRVLAQIFDTDTGPKEEMGRRHGLLAYGRNVAELVFPSLDEVPISDSEIEEEDDDGLKRQLRNADVLDFGFGCCPATWTTTPVGLTRRFLR
jgi:hypothetical protein